jgi:hypothetical protein
MADDSNKKSTQKAASDGGKKGNPPAALSSAWVNGGPVKMLLSFYDQRTMDVLYPDDGNELEIQNADGTILQTVTLTRNTSNGYPVSFPAPTAPTPTKIETAENSCDDPKINPAAMVLVASSKPLSVDCQAWDMVKVGVALPQPFFLGRSTSETTANALTGTESRGISTGPNALPNPDDAMCSVELPMMQLEETYMVKFQAFDTCYEDFLTNGDAVLDDVVLRLKAIQTPAQASQQTDGNRGHLGRQEGRHSDGRAGRHSSVPTARFKSGSFTAKTVNGLAFVGGLVPHQQYQVEVIGPGGYVPVSSNLPPYIQNSGLQTLPLMAGFQPCTNFPARSIVFVRKECPGARVEELRFSASGVYPSPNLTKGDNGVWNIPTGTTGRIDLQAGGKIFSPASLDLSKEAPMVFVVEVADAATEVSGARKHRFQHVDEQGRGFAHRWIRLVSRNGREERVLTDENGWFEAEDGSVASTDEDDVGDAVQAFPLLTTEME